MPRRSPARLQGCPGMACARARADLRSSPRRWPDLPSPKMRSRRQQPATCRFRRLMPGISRNSRSFRNRGLRRSISCRSSARISHPSSRNPTHNRSTGRLHRRHHRGRKRLCRIRCTCRRRTGAACPRRIRRRGRQSHRGGRHRRDISRRGHIRRTDRHGPRSRKRLHRIRRFGHKRLRRRLLVRQSQPANRRPPLM